MTLRLKAIAVPATCGLTRRAALSCSDAEDGNRDPLNFERQEFAG
jgi:hypothetical protein